MSAPHRPKSNAIGFAIEELEARRTAALDQVAEIDRALETLRALM